jgi:hypothetical protein
LEWGKKFRWEMAVKQMDGRECVYSFHDPISGVKITETMFTSFRQKTHKWQADGKTFLLHIQFT